MKQLFRSVAGYPFGLHLKPGCILDDNGTIAFAIKEFQLIVFGKKVRVKDVISKKHIIIQINEKIT